MTAGGSGPTDEVSVGRQLGRYELVGELGRGGMGVVYRAWDPELRRAVAIKTSRYGEPARLMREARAAARLQHPGLVRVLDVGSEGGTVFLAMELVEGPTLAQVLAEGPLPPSRAATWIAQIAAALASAHGAGVVHRDVKPGNVLLEGGEVARLTDFGLARSLDATQTMLGAVVGTPRYLAPEQARGEPVSPATDVHALGVVLAECVVGRPWLEDQDVAVLVERIAHRPLPALDSLGGRVDPELARVIHKACAFDPSDRYADAGAMEQDLRRWLEGAPVHAADLSAWRRLRGWSRLHRRALAAAGATAVVLGVGAVALELVRASRITASEVEREQTADRRVGAALDRARELQAAGRSDEARALFERVAQLPEVQQTTALSRGWLARAEMSHGDPEVSLDAVGRAWMAAPRAAQAEGQVLLALADELRRAQRDESVAAVSTLAREHAPEVRAAGEGRRLAAEGAWWFGELDDPVLEEDADLWPLVEHWRSALEVPSALDQLWEVDLPGGRALVAQIGTDVVRVDPDTMRATEVLASDVVVGKQHVEGTPWLYGGGQTVDLRTGAIRASPPYMSLSVRVDDDWWLGTYPGGVIRFRPETSELVPVSVPVVALGTADGLVEAEVDGIPPLERAYGVGAWGGFDFRVERADGSLLTHVRDGAQGRTRAVRVGERDWLLVATGAPFGSRLVFPSGDPMGLPAGIRLYAWDQDHLAVQLERRLDGYLSPVVRDLDGDGRLDLLVGGTDRILVARQLPGERFAMAVLGGARLVAAFDREEDGRAEVLVLRPDGRRFALGAGSAPMPPTPRQTSSTEPDPLVRRAIELAELGVTDGAIAGLETVIAMEGGAGDVAARAHLAAGRLSAGRAAEEHLRAAADIDPALAAEAWTSAARSAASVRRFGDATAWADRLAGIGVALPEADRWARVAASRVALDLTEERPEIELLARDGVQRRLDGWWIENAEDREILRVPLRTVGPWLRVELEGTLDRLEWGAGLSVSVEDEEGRRLAASRLRGTGGGRVVTLEARCDVPIETQPLALPDPVPAVGRELRWWASAGEPELRCGVDDASRAWLSSRDVPETDAWLVLRGHDEGDAQLTRLLLRSLGVEGAVLREVPPAPAAPEDPRGRLAEAEAAGDAPAVARALAAVDEDDLPALLRTGDASRVRALRARPDFVQLFARSFGASAFQHPDDPELGRHLREDLPDLPSLERPSGLEPEEWLGLLVARGHALVVAGEGRDADRHFRRAAEVAATLPEQTRHGQVLLVTLSAMDAAIRAGDDASADRWMAWGQTLTPFPELLADSVGRLRE
ncbi:MAG: protein kinase [Alphaproteobacteria bacterium]|nr:protein kinase [Alphaproteobacteria bacterium]MCB9698864.1 protein kinase [Alphaproteobacteria bacterium]